MTPFYERLPGVKLPGSPVTNVDSAGKTVLGLAAAADGVHAVVGAVKRIAQCKCSSNSSEEEV